MTQETRFKEINPVIPTRDMQRAVSFYEEQLGFQKAFDDAPRPGALFSYAGVSRDGFCLHLQSTARGEDPTMPLIRIRVEHIETLYEEYQRKGIIGPSRHLEAKPWGSKDFGV